MVIQGAKTGLVQGILLASFKLIYHSESSFSLSAVGVNRLFKLLTLTVCNMCKELE